MSTPVPESGVSARVPTGLLVASTLCWVWGIIGGLAGLGLLIPGLASALGRAGILLPFVFFLIAIVYGLAGYLIRKARVFGGWVGIIMAGLVGALELLGLTTGGRPSVSALTGLLLNILIVALLSLNWRHLYPSRQ